jgi:class 3 adenylate cyclase/Tfp pilus assembly protein PilF
VATGSASLEAYVPRLSVSWTGPPARELDGSLVSLDLSGFTALSERLQTRGRAGAEELVGLISGVFDGLIAISDRYGGDVLKFRGDALLILFFGDDHYRRAFASTNEMQALIGETGQTMSSVGAVTLRMAAGIYTGPCHFFLLDTSHRELLVAGPAATETIQLESEAAAGEIRLSSPAPEGRPQPYDPPSAPAHQPDFEAFIPAPLRAQLRLEAGEAEHRLVTASFLKFSGVGAVLELGGLEALHAELAALTAHVDAICTELGLTWLDSDIDTDGGKLYIVGGAPSSTGEDEARALHAFRRILDEYAGRLVLRGGMNRGGAFCGDVGASSRRTYSVMGDTVNLAARLAARAEPGGLLVTGDVLDRTRTRYETRVEPLLVKGKERPITAYHVGPATGLREDEASAELPLVGRDAELVALGEALNAARLRQQQLVELVGEPGIGKSRLVEELKRQALGFTQLESRCDPYASARPYFALRALMRPLAGITPELDEEAAGAQLAPWVSAVMPDLAPWLPLLAIPFGAQVEPTPETDEIDPAFRRERLLDTVEQFLTRVLLMPTLLDIEDVHWADDASFELIRHLVRHAAPRPWLVCITRRPQGGGLAGDVVGHMRLALDRLTNGDVQTLAVEAAGELALSEQALATVRERSGGNPLFIRELVNAARTAGSVDALPETVETVITSRIDTLSPEDRFLLRNASVLGTRFELDVLEDVLDGELEGVGDHARWERLAEFIVWESASGLRFAHDLFRAVAYEGLSFRRRREMHARVGDALARREADPALLSLHFLEADRYQEAWDYATTAADKARAGFANVVAAELYGRALAAAEHLELEATELARICEALGEVALLFADFDRASDAFGRARRLVGDRATLLLREGRICEGRGLYGEAFEWAERAAAAAEDEDTRIEVETLQAGLLFRQGRFEESIECGRLAVEHAEAAGDLRALAHACQTLDGSLTQVGRSEPALLERSLALFEELGDLLGLGATLNNLGINAYYAGRWNEALDLYRRSAEAKRRSGDVEGSAIAIHNEAEILCDQGHFDEAEALFRDALRAARAAGLSMTQAFVTANLGRLAARTQRFDDAHSLLDEAAEHLAAIGSQALALETDARRVECLVLEGRHGEARELAERALGRAAELGQTGNLGPALERLLGYALCQDRRRDESASHFERSLELARNADATYEKAMTLRAIADTRHEASVASAELFEQLGVVALPSVPLP